MYIILYIDTTVSFPSKQIRTNHTCHRPLDSLGSLSADTACNLLVAIHASSEF